NVLGPNKCQHGHLHKEGMGAFCDKDGTKFNQEENKILNPNFKKLLKSEGFNSDFDELENEDLIDHHFNEEFNEFTYDENILFDDEDISEIFLGTKIMQCSDYKSLKDSISLLEFNKNVEKIKDWAKQLEIPDIEPELFLNLDII